MAIEPKTTTAPAPAPAPAKPPVAPVPVAPAALEGAEAIVDLQRRMDRVESLMPVAVGLPLPPFPVVPDDDLEAEIAAKEAELIALRARRAGHEHQEWPKWVKDGAGNDTIAESPEHEAELQKVRAAPEPRPHEPAPPPAMPPPAPRRPPASGTTVAG